MCRSSVPFSEGVGSFLGCDFPFIYDSMFIGEDELESLTTYFLTYFLCEEDRVPQLLALIALFNEQGNRGLRFHTLRASMPQYWDHELRRTVFLCLRFQVVYDLHYVSLYLASMPSNLRVSPFDYGSDSDPDSDPEF